MMFNYFLKTQYELEYLCLGWSRAQAHVPALGGVHHRPGTEVHEEADGYAD